jgi:hypothetical protein
MKVITDKSDNELSEESIIKALSDWLDSRKFPFRIPRAFIYGWESDYWCMTADGETREFEIKISRSDYAADKKKGKHSDTSKGANYFYYVCPAGLIAKEEVSGNYGLIYVHQEFKSLEVVKKPKKLNAFKFTQWMMLANKMYWKWYALWRTKYVNKEVTYREFKEQFNLELQSNEMSNESINSLLP